MCAGPVKNLIEDATGITKAKSDAKKAAQEAEAAAKAAAEEKQTFDDNFTTKKDELTKTYATEEQNIKDTLGVELTDILQKNSELEEDLMQKSVDQIVAGPTGPSASELAARGAARTSQGILDKEKKKKKGALKIPYSPSKRKQGDRGPKSTKADLQIEGQTQTTGTGTNLAI
tara:strand:- start:159 stop:677 length:519 start_codon:yes stop_codon:yes gene_type:complete